MGDCKRSQINMPVVYESNDGLRHNQLAYFVRTRSGKLLCIGHHGELSSSSACGIGDSISNSDQRFMFNIKRSEYDIKNSPIFGTYLFDYFLKHEYN